MVVLEAGEVDTTVELLSLGRVVATYLIVDVVRLNIVVTIEDDGVADGEKAKAETEQELLRN